MAAGDTVHIVARLTPESSDSKTIDVFKVQGEIIRTAEGSMIKQIQDGATVTDAITAERMSKGTDSNAAEALERVTGVTKVGGNVYVRGLGERYSQTQVNGVAVGTPEPNKRVVPLDIFPAGVLDNVIIQKTYTPDLDGEFAGSVIKLNTKEFAKNMFRQSLSLGRTEYSEEAFWNYSGGSMDALGFDDGTRALPDAVGEDRVDRSRYSREELAQKGMAFENIWTPRKGGAKPNFSYSALISRKMSLFGKKTGILGTASLSNSNNSIARTNNIYSGGVSLPPLRLYDVKESETNVLGGLSATVGTELAEDHHLKLSALYTRQANDGVKIQEGLNFDRGPSDVRETELTYVQRGLLSGVIEGTHENQILGSKLGWRVGISRATREEPDRRKTVYESREGGPYLANGAGSQYPLTRIFGNSHDDDKSYQVDWTLPLGDRETEGHAFFQTGVALRTKDRFSEFRRFGFTGRLRPFDVPPADLTLPAEDLTSRANLENNGLYPGGRVAEERYLQRGSENHRGVRHGGVQHPPQAATLDRGPLREIFPAGGRVGPARTPGKSVRSDRAEGLRSPALGQPHLGRQRQDESALGLCPDGQPSRAPGDQPLHHVRLHTGYAETGDTNLVAAKINNYDIRWEVYPRPGELFSLAAFYKDFENPIQKSLAPSTGNYAVRPKNGEEAELYGFETELRLTLHSVWSALDWAMDLGPVPGFTDPWGFVANYSRGEVGGGPHRERRADHQPLRGPVRVLDQPRDLLQQGALGELASLQELRQAPELLRAGPGSSRRLRVPGQGLDMTVNYRFSGTTKLKVAVENLLSDSPEYRQGSKVTQSYDKGMSFAVSVSYEAESED